MSDLVRYEFESSIATITMDDGKANVMSAAMLEALAGAFDRALADRAVVVLTGRPGMFSAGYDRGMFQRDQDEIRTTLRAGGNLVHRILAHPFPIIAACTGHTIAQGVFTMLAADVRIGVRGAFKIGLNEVAIGLTLPRYGVELARHRLPPQGFQYSTLTGALFGPDRALALGFFDELVEPDELAAHARSQAETLRAISMGAHAGTKARVRAPALAAIRAGIDEELGG